MQVLSQILSPQRTVSRMAGSSKKRLFETIAKIVCNDQPALTYGSVLDHLIAREKLGSTGLGQGIAIPHCRVENCSQPLGTLVTLEKPLPFDAPDEAPVDLLFILLVPAQAHQQHLDILADIARVFNQPEFCASLRAADNHQTLFDIACGNSP